MSTINYDDFTKIEIRTGTIISADVFTKAKKPAYLMKIDFGEHGIRKTSAQITNLYRAEELPGKQVVAVINFPARQIADIMSECLVLGAVEENGDVVLLETERQTKNGLRIL